MKKSYLPIVFIICMNNLVYSQVVDIPDPYFKDKLINHEPVIDTNSDGEIQISEAETFTGAILINGNSSNPGLISDLTGIETFINIDELNCDYNQISSLSLTNPNLLTISCNNNIISNLDVANNEQLRTLSASGNLFSTLDLSNNSNLEFLQSNFGNLSILNVSNNPVLHFLYVQNNLLTVLDLNNNSQLYGLICDNNELEHLDLSNNPLLGFLYCRGNQFIELDLSNNTELITVDCKSNNELTYINLRNGSNENLNISEGSQSCNFENLPLLESVCLDDINSSLADFITAQAGHSVEFIEDCSLGNEEHLNNRISIYPNPFEHFLTILSDKKVIDIEIYNLIGQIVYENRGQRIIEELNLSNLISGVYIIILTDETSNQSIQKIIKK